MDFLGLSLVQTTAWYRAYVCGIGFILDVGSIREGSRFQVERCSADVVSSGKRVEAAKAGPCPPGSASLPSRLRVRAGAGSANVGLLREPLATPDSREQGPIQL